MPELLYGSEFGPAPGGVLGKELRGGFTLRLLLRVESDWLEAEHAPEEPRPAHLSQ